MTSRHLLNILAEVPDFRNKRGKRHPLSAILALANHDCRSYTAIAEYGRTYHKDLAKALTHKKTPCASTLHVFKAIAATDLECALTQWAIAVFEDLPTETQTHAIAIDGSVEAKQGATLTHLVVINSAFRSHSNPLLRNLKIAEDIGT